MSIKTEHLLDEQEGIGAIHRQQDCEPILEDVKRRRSMGCTQSRGPDNHRHLASFPAVVVERYCQLNNISFREWLESEEHVTRMLRDPDLSGFRVHEGRE